MMKLINFVLLVALMVGLALAGVYVSDLFKPMVKEGCDYLKEANVQTVATDVDC